MRSQETNRRRDFQRQSRLRLIWFLVSLVPIWALVVAILEGPSYHRRDPRFATKLASLQALQKARPGQPLWLMLGSSKVEDGLKPDLISRTPEDPIVFNFGNPGGKLVWEYLALLRLLEADIQPQWLGIEIVGPTLSRSAPLFDADWSSARVLRWRELDRSRPFTSNHAELRRMWWRSRLTPNLVLRQIFESKSAWERHGFDRFGWRTSVRTSVSTTDYQKQLETRRKEYLPCWKNFAVSPEADRCLRALLDLCRARGIKAFIYEMPEAPQFSAFSPPGTRAAIETYLGKIATLYRIPWVNARDWVDDSGYSDGLHLIRPGAEQFSKRFRDEVFQPFVREWPIQPLTSTEQPTRRRVQL